MRSSTRGTNLVILTVSVQNLTSEILSKSSGNDAGPQTRRQKRPHPTECIPQRLDELRRRLYGLDKSR